MPADRAHPETPQSVSHIRTWRDLFRPHTVTASFVPAFTGTAYALAQTGLDALHPDRFLAFFFTILLLQTAANLFNEYYDYVRGLDTKESWGIGGAIVHDRLSAKTVRHTALLSGGAACLFGLYLCAQTSWLLLPVGVICGLTTYLYTGGPRPIAYTPFGELVAGGVMGCAGVNTAFFLQTGTVTAGSVLVSIPATILIGVILSANNIRDMDNDRASGRKTLVILLGRKHSITYLTTAYITAFAWIACLTAANLVSAWALLGLLGILPAWQSVVLFTRHCAPKDLMPAMKRSAQTNTVAGILFSLGMLLGFLLN